MNPIKAFRRSHAVAAPPTGQLRDVRSKKYGEDRYDKWADGPVGPRAMTAISVAAAVAAAAFLLLGFLFLPLGF